MNSLREIIRQAIDLHFHIGPEIIPRKYDIKQLIDAEKGNIGGFVLKNHFYSTSKLIKNIGNSKGLNLYGSITLNNYVGGLNDEAIALTAQSVDNPIIVWFPTINAKNFLTKSEFEIAPEWVNNKNFIPKKSCNVDPVELNENKVVNALKVIKKYNAVLATGHISWQESVDLVEKAVKNNISRIIITHPIYQQIDMPIKIQKKLAGKGCFIEHCYSMYSIDKISIQKIAGQIKEVGCKSVVISSDMGQLFSPKPSIALLDFTNRLRNEGIEEDELFTMLVKNPKKLMETKK